MSDIARHIPTPWRSPAALILAVALVVVATAGVTSYMRAMADERIAPVAAELKQHKADIDSRLQRMEEKLDRLIER